VESLHTNLSQAEAVQDPPPSFNVRMVSTWEKERLQGN
jgi:hypothetical protein